MSQQVSSDVANTTTPPLNKQTNIINEQLADNSMIHELLAPVVPRWWRSRGQATSLVGTFWLS